MNVPRRNPAVLIAVLTALVLLLPGSGSGATLSQLRSQLGGQQARAQSLAGGLARLSALAAGLERQIAVVRGREADVRGELGRDRVALSLTVRRLHAERLRLARLRTQMDQARTLLARQLVSGYESDRPDLVGVILNAHGFTDLLEQLTFLRRAEDQQQTLVSVIRQERARAAAAAHRLASLRSTQRRAEQATALQARALAGMDQLLAVKQAALARVSAAQGAALAASRARAGALRSQIGQIQARQAAAARAAAARAAADAAAASSSAPAAPAGPALGASGGWAIPYAIVLCESGGQDLPPNSAGASGYYQILPSTWTLYGGSGPAAYLAPKAEQDAVAARIWDGGRGASQWVCAGVVGIH
jgi:septal ring factor EnvC (AmiA/AmiB activator)